MKLSAKLANEFADRFIDRDFEPYFHLDDLNSLINDSNCLGFNTTYYFDDDNDDNWCVFYIPLPGTCMFVFEESWFGDIRYRSLHELIAGLLDLEQQARAASFRYNLPLRNRPYETQ